MLSLQETIKLKRVGLLSYEKQVLENFDGSLNNFFPKSKKIKGFLWLKLRAQESNGDNQRGHKDQL